MAHYSQQGQKPQIGEQRKVDTHIMRLGGQEEFGYVQNSEHFMMAKALTSTFAETDQVMTFGLVHGHTTAVMTRSQYNQKLKEDKSGPVAQIFECGREQMKQSSMQNITREGDFNQTPVSIQAVRDVRLQDILNTKGLSVFVVEDEAMHRVMNAQVGVEKPLELAHLVRHGKAECLNPAELPQIGMDMVKDVWAQDRALGHQFAEVALTFRHLKETAENKVVHEQKKAIEPMMLRCAQQRQK